MGKLQPIRLNQGQKDCLRLVLGHLNSKEIGRELNISPHTVDQRLRTAMRALEANTRFEAARKFADLEGEDTYQPLIYQSSDIEESVETVTLTGSAKQEGTNDQGLMQNVSNMKNGSATLSFDNPSNRQGRLPFPRYYGEKNELSSVERLGWIIAIAIGSAVSFGGILAGLEALSRLSG